MYMCMQELVIPKWQPVSLLHRTAALWGGMEYVSPVQLAAGLILGALRMNCVLLKLWLKRSTLTFTHLRCKESFGFFLHHHFVLLFVLFFIKVLTVHI